MTIRLRESITARCPTDSDEDTARLFDMQVARLQAIIDEDVHELPGRVASSWIKKCEDGSSSIEMTMYGSPSELAIRMDLVHGTALEILVSLCKDERVDEMGGRVKLPFPLHQEYQLISQPDDSQQTVRADENYPVDFGMTRDKSVHFEGRTVHCFSCKSAASSLRSASSELSQCYKPFPTTYIGWIIGQIHSVRAEFGFRLANGDTEMVLNCYVITLSCADSADDEEREFYARQARVLQQVMDCDLHNICDASGSQSMIGSAINGLPTINVVVNSADMELWNGGGWAFQMGTQLRAAISLQRHDGVRSQKHTYTAWLQFFSLSDDSHSVNGETIVANSTHWESEGWGGGGWGASESWGMMLGSVAVQREREMASPLFEDGLKRPGIVSRVAMSASERVHRWVSHAGRVQRKIYSNKSFLEKELSRATVLSIFMNYIVDATLYQLRSISRVPPEIWRTIFQLAYAGGGSAWSPDSVLYVPMSVCRQWRDVLAGGAAADLWNPIDFRGVSHRKCRARVAQVEYVMAHSSLDLSLGLEDMNALLGATLHRLVSSINELTLNVHDFYCPAESVAGQLARSIFRVQSPVPNVSSLTIEGVTFGTGEFPCGGSLPQWAQTLTPEQTLMQWSWPQPSKLRKVTFLWTLTPETCFNLPWVEIQSYAEFNTARIHGTLPITHLSNMHNLRVLCLSGVRLPSASALQIAFPQVQELNFVVPWHNVPPEGHFVGISFPNLQVLRLHVRSNRGFGEDAAGARFHRELEAFLFGCPALSRVSLALQIPFSGDTLIRHMRAIPALSALHIFGADRDMMDSEFILGLTNELIAPRLQVLSIQPGRYWDEYTDENPQQRSELVHAFERRFELGLKVLDFSHRAVHSGPHSKTHHDLWETATGWDWIYDRWAVGGVKVSDSLRRDLEVLSARRDVAIGFET
ncbi:hypothetical protein R3P38DRAFT_2763250 [Favolaschia claudopus]|uniref:F-box domain-containing protein n=1 Tax=Favolaschia claudopus TaxID=2862362 RepID=A0AAW0DBV4_9AGAR